MNRQLRDLAEIYYGKSPVGYRVEHSEVPIYATSGQVGFASEPLFGGPLIVVARKGTLDNPTFSREACWVIDTAYAVVPRSDVDAKWLFYALSNHNLSALNEATGVPSISRDYLYRVELDKPDLNEQRKIAHILTTVDDLIDRTEALIAKLRAIKQGLMHDLLTRGVDEHSQLRPPREEAPELYRESAVGWVPREWEIRTLGSVAEVGNGVTLGRKLSGPGVVEFPYLRVANVQDRYLDLSEIKLVQVLQSEVGRYLLEPGDMLMTEGGDFDKLGRGVVWEGQVAPCLHQNHIFRVRADQNLLVPKFLETISGSAYGKRYFLRSSKQTTNLATINSTQLKAFPIPRPPIAEQERIVGTVAACDIRIQVDVAFRNKLVKLTTGLMQDLLTGKVRVIVD